MPRQPSGYQGSLSRTDPVVTGQFCEGRLASGVAGSQLRSLVDGRPGIWLLGASEHASWLFPSPVVVASQSLFSSGLGGLDGPPAIPSVTGVLQVGPRVQVRARRVRVGVDAAAVVAVMEQVAVFRADDQLPDNPMRETGAASDVDDPVAVLRAEGGGPLPARSALGAVPRDWPLLVHLRPDAISERAFRAGLVQDITRPGTEPSTATSNVGPFGLKRCAARRARLGDAQAGTTYGALRQRIIRVHRTLQWSAATPRPVTRRGDFSCPNCTTSPGGARG